MGHSTRGGPDGLDEATQDWDGREARANLSSPHSYTPGMTKLMIKLYNWNLLSPPSIQISTL